MPKTVLPKKGGQENDVWLTVEEIDRMTEPGHRKRNSELIRELVERIMSQQQEQVASCGGDIHEV